MTLYCFELFMAIWYTLY